MVRGLAAWLALELAGCLTAHAASPEDRTALLGGREVHEECTDLEPGQTLTYSFTCSGPLDFNIHYHDRLQAHYPVVERHAQSVQGRFRAPHKDTFCLMWTNPESAEVDLTYRFTLD